MGDGCSLQGQLEAYFSSHPFLFIFNKEALIPEVSENEFPGILRMLAWMRETKEQSLLFCFFFSSTESLFLTPCKPKRPWLLHI